MKAGSDRDDDRHRIMEAAYSRLLESDDRPTPVSAILRGAGLSSRAFYRHFSSKDDLYLALLSEACGTLVARVTGVAESAVGSPADQLAAWIGEMFEAVVDPHLRKQLAVIDSSEVRAAKGYGELREQLHVDRERSLAEILRRGRADGSFPLTDPDADAIAVNAVISRVVAQQDAGDVQGVKNAQGRVLDFVLRAVGAVATG